MTIWSQWQKLELYWEGEKFFFVFLLQEFPMQRRQWATWGRTTAWCIRGKAHQQMHFANSHKCWIGHFRPLCFIELSQDEVIVHVLTLKLLFHMRQFVFFTDKQKKSQYRFLILDCTKCCYTLALIIMKCTPVSACSYHFVLC
jgi:hypothetical protein